LTIQFDPTVAGAATGTLTITSNSSSNPTATVSLTGTGVQTYQVSITWQAPTSSTDPVASYSIYRSPSGASTYQLMATVSSTQLSYTDTYQIVNGQSFDYIVESVDSSGVDSVPSNTATAAIP
jgi:hypothetical protein